MAIFLRSFRKQKQNIVLNIILTIRYLMNLLKLQLNQLVNAILLF